MDSLCSVINRPRLLSYRILQLFSCRSLPSPAFCRFSPVAVWTGLPPVRLLLRDERCERKKCPSLLVLAHVLLPRVDPLCPPSPKTNTNLHSCLDCRPLQQPSYGALTASSDFRPHFAPSAFHPFPVAARDGWTCQDVVEQGAGGLCSPQEAREGVAAGRFRRRNPQNVSRRAVGSRQARHLPSKTILRANKSAQLLCRGDCAVTCSCNILLSDMSPLFRRRLKYSARADC